MGNSIQTFEIKVEVKKKGSKHFSSHVGMYIEQGMVKMFHKDARTSKQAMQKCEKYGRPISARKVDLDRLVGASLPLPEVHGTNNPYPDAIAMGEMIWRKKANRGKRIENRGKDKEDY